MSTVDEISKLQGLKEFFFVGEQELRYTPLDRMKQNKVINVEEGIEHRY